MSIPNAVRLLAVKRKRLGLSRSLISRLLKIPEATLWRWENGVHQPSVYYSAQIQKLIRVIEKIERDTSK